jgi:hypothetical protein
LRERGKGVLALSSGKHFERIAMLLDKLDAFFQRLKLAPRIRDFEAIAFRLLQSLFLRPKHALGDREVGLGFGETFID